MTPLNAIRPRDIAWSALAAFVLAASWAVMLAAPVAAAGGCVYTIDGQDLDAASSPERAIKVSNDQTIVLTASGPGPLGQLHVAAWFWPTSVEVPQPAPTSASTWTGTVDLSAQPVAVQGLYQIEISKDPADCPPSTGWLQISGGNPFTTVPGAIGTGMAVVGSIAIVVALRGALAGRGGAALGAIGGALIGLGALVVAQQAGAVPADARSAAVWTVLPGAIGGTVTRTVGRVFGRSAPTAEPPSYEPPPQTTAAEPPPPPYAPPPPAAAPPVPATAPPAPGAEPLPAPSDAIEPLPAPSDAIGPPPTAGDEPPPAPSDAIGPPPTAADEPPPQPSAAEPPPPAAAAEPRRPSVPIHPASPTPISRRPTPWWRRRRSTSMSGLAPSPTPTSDAAPLVRPAWSHGDYTLTVQLLADGFERDRPRSGSVADRPDGHRREAISDRDRAAPCRRHRQTVRGRQIRATYSVEGQVMGVATRQIAVVDDAARLAALAAGRAQDRRPRCRRRAARQRPTSR